MISELFVKVFGVLFAVVCLGLGALLLFRPDVMLAINRMSKKWVATDSLEKELNRTRDVDGKLFKIRKVIGCVLLALAIIFVVIAFM